MPKKGEYITFKNYARQIKLPFIIYEGFEGNEKQNPEKS